MNRRAFQVPLIARAAAVTLLVGCLPAAAPAARSSPLPSLKRVEQAVLGYFAEQPDYRPGDIITRAQAKSVLAILGRMGFRVADADELLRRVPADGDYLVKTLRTDSGRRFMRQVSRFPKAYDRLDRLSRLPHGKQTIHDLIRGPDGYKMIEYMTTTSGGNAMGKMLSNAPRGKDFNAATGRIYTAEALLAQLKARYAAARQPPAGR